MTCGERRQSNRDHIAQALYEHDKVEPHLSWPPRDERVRDQYLLRADAVLSLSFVGELGGDAERTLIRDLGIFGPVNGMNENDAAGSYFRLILTKDEIREERLISQGAAEVFVAEAAGMMHDSSPAEYLVEESDD